MFLAVGELINHLVIDSAVFRLPVLYNQRLPDHKSGMITVQKTPKHLFNDAFAPNKVDLSQPRTQSLGFIKKHTLKLDNNQVIKRVFIVDSSIMRPFVPVYIEFCVVAMFVYMLNCRYLYD